MPLQQRCKRRPGLDAACVSCVGKHGRIDALTLWLTAALTTRYLALSFLLALCGFDVKWPTPIVAVCTHLLTIELLLLMFWARASSRAAYFY